MRLQAIAYVALAVALPFQAAAQNPGRDLQKAVERHERGVNALRQGKHAEATKHFRKALDVVPSFPGSHMGLGRIALEDQRYEDALAAFTAARDGYAALGPLLYSYETERYQNARRQLIDLEEQRNRLERQPPNSNELIQHEQRKALVALESRIRALDSIPLPVRDSLAEVPGEIHFALGNALFSLGRTDEAIAAWESAVAGRDPVPAAHANLTLAYLHQGRLDDARNSHQQATALGFAVDADLTTALQRQLAARAAARGGVAVTYEEEDPP